MLFYAHCVQQVLDATYSVPCMLGLKPLNVFGVRELGKLQQTHATLPQMVENSPKLASIKVRKLFVNPKPTSAVEDFRVWGC